MPTFETESNEPRGGPASLTGGPASDARGTGLGATRPWAVLTLLAALSGGPALGLLLAVGPSASLLALLGGVALALLLAVRLPQARPTEGLRSWQGRSWVVLLVGWAALAILTTTTGAGLERGVGPVLAPVLSPFTLALLAVSLAILAIASPTGVDPRLRVMQLTTAGLTAATALLTRGGSAQELGAVVGAAAMVAIFVVALQYLYRTKQLSAGISKFLLGWTVAAAFLAAGWFLWSFEGSAPALALGLVAAASVGFYSALATRLTNDGLRVPWLLRPIWVFGVLLGIFLADFFLGALLDLTIAGPGFLQFIPFVPPSGAGATLVGQLVYNGLWFGSAILASAWFLVVLGFTMGPLVALKIREAHEPAQKYRLGLTIVVFGLASIYIPSLTSSTPLANVPWLQNVPVIGWGFGLRGGGPFESGVFLAVILMYVSVGVLTVLFGRKALCSVMCGAALMYQGTAMSEMRQFNQTSRVGKHFLGSQLSTAYVVASGVALVSLFGVSLAAFLHLLPSVQVASGQLDSAALPLPIMLYFGGVWFAMFVTTPFIGTYNCATTGFCHWGALSIPFAKVSFFKLKVKDRTVCQNCTTFDCAKACPVGLVDMPLYFRTKGEYTSTKCCGVGDCVGACPYGNMYHQDVRLWVRRKFSGGGAQPRTPPHHGTPLPMVAAAPVPTVGPTVTAGAGPHSGAP